MAKHKKSMKRRGLGEGDAEDLTSIKARATQLHKILEDAEGAVGVRCGAALSRLEHANRILGALAEQERHENVSEGISKMIASGQDKLFDVSDAFDAACIIPTKKK